MSVLETLATRLGIENSFQDARGDMRETSGETRRALLAAMGYQADSDAAAKLELDRLDRIDWERALPPVCVVRQNDEPLSVPLTLPHGPAAISWRIDLEDGGEQSGETTFAQLEFIAQHTLDDARHERRRLELKPDIPLGYHRLTVTPGGETTLIVTPAKCWLPPRIEQGHRLWGVAAQLYLLRSAENWGIGDYSDLRRLAELLVPLGADVIGLNPLHAMFLDNPEHASPYSPASRLLLNVLNIDVTQLPELAECAEARTLIGSEAFQQAVANCQSAHLVNYATVARLKMQVFRLLFATCQSDRGCDRWQAFEAFRHEHGSMLEQGCLYEALRQHFAEKDARHADWHAWPEEYRDPHSLAVRDFADTHVELISFRTWLQFAADTQLGFAAQAASPMAIGLYRDLAVGADPSGAETWANQTAVVADAQVGAPPDIYNPPGQDWGLPPFNPRALREEAYRSFIDLVRANMRHAGGLRIDHVMALQHLYWVPKGRSPAEGAYVAYPLKELVGILALESHRNHCLVVGEDLGTVPEGFRQHMEDANILSYRVLFFEKDESGFLPPDRYPALALAVAGSHDLPTLRAWWEVSDLDLKERLNLFPEPAQARQAREERKRDRAELIAALRHTGLIAADAELDVEQLIRAAHAYLARSPAALAMAQIDDIANEADPVNVPTTSNEHPNWRRRQSLTLEQLTEHPRLSGLAQIFKQERGSA